MPNADQQKKCQQMPMQTESLRQPTRHLEIQLRQEVLSADPQMGL
jgi:hypothetical protein